ncbi:hypothetical protein RhiirA4_473807 [Rhizophagus irregularis]|uniref:Uncharacterized protein n=1 Tax=Rhizophagus irregularis TaxID=588596 RepID=A0A2I1H7F8_9GLOM|nr:hypothetical protein RhiirA4_473807 [Rhizophagus irregularis]
MQMNILIDCGLDTSYFLEFPPHHSDHTSSSNDASISENKKHDRKRRKLDHLVIDSASDGSGVETPEFSSIDWNRKVYSTAEPTVYLDDDDGIEAFLW